MTKSKAMFIAGLFVAYMSVAVIGPGASSGAQIKELVVSAGNTDLVYCPVRLICETPTALAGIRSLRTADENQRLPIQVQKTDRASLVTFILPELKANQTLRLVPSKDSAAGDRVVVEKAAEDQIDIRIGNNLLTSYCYPSDSEKPYLYPVIGPKGTHLTRGYPMVDLDYEEELKAKDHPHHRSLWVAYGNVNGGDFWSMGRDPARRDTQKTDGILVSESGPVYGRLVAKNSWISKEGKRVVTERREYVFYNTPEENRVIDSIVTFIATDGKVTFGDTKEGGICALRLNPKIDEKHGTGVMRNSEGGKGAGECWGKRAEWCDYYGTLDGNVVGIAVLDHPRNLRHPTWWHIRDYGLYTANCFGLHDFDRSLRENRHAGDYVLEAGKSLTFRYRLLLHAGDTDQANVAHQYAAFASPPKATIVWAD